MSSIIYQLRFLFFLLNQLIYVSGRVSALYEKMVKETLSSGPAGGMLPAAMEGMLTKLMTVGSSAGLSVIQMHPDGMVMQTHTEGMGYDTMALAGTAAIPVALGGAYWMAGSFAQDLLGGSSGPFDGGPGLDMELEEGFPVEGEGGSDPIGGAVPIPSPSIPPERFERKK